MTTQDTYARHGVNIAAGDDFSSFAGTICQASYGNSPFVEVKDFSSGHFRGPKAWRFKNLPENCYFDGAPDGIGTKVVIIDAAKNWGLAARDVFAMTGGDITRFGGKPLLFLNVLDVSTLGDTGSSVNKAARSLMQGLGDVAKKQEVVCYRGETAELSVCVTSENPEGTLKFNWAGCMIGAFLEDRIITGETLAPGQVVVALREHGCRSNGISSVRGGLREHFGTDWYENEEAAHWVNQAATASTLYDLFLSDMNGWSNPISDPRFKVHLIAHISGGGIVDKFGNDNLFRYGLSARLDGLYTPPEVLRKVVEWTGMAEAETYKTFSSGNGALVVLDADDVDSFISAAQPYGIEAKAAGVVTKNQESVLKIKSQYTGNWLEYHPETA